MPDMSSPHVREILLFRHIVTVITDLQCVPEPDVIIIPTRPRARVCPMRFTTNRPCFATKLFRYILF